jgi:hypothetical protein
MSDLDKRWHLVQTAMICSIASRNIWASAAWLVFAVFMFFSYIRSANKSRLKSSDL